MTASPTRCHWSDQRVDWSGLYGQGLGEVNTRVANLSFFLRCGGKRHLRPAHDSEFRPVYRGIRTAADYPQPHRRPGQSMRCRTGAIFVGRCTRRSPGFPGGRSATRGPLHQLCSAFHHLTGRLTHNGSAAMVPFDSRAGSRGRAAVRETRFITGTVRQYRRPLMESARQAGSQWRPRPIVILF